MLLALYPALRYYSLTPPLDLPHKPRHLPVFYMAQSTAPDLLGDVTIDYLAQTGLI